MTTSLNDFLNQCQNRVNQALDSALQPQTSPFSDFIPEHLAQLIAAMRYSSLQGGKRLRPALLYASAHAIGEHPVRHEDLDTLAAAIECIHAYSLIHDDLPAMDDDDLRRGQPTCHRAFDEATAILAGDALQCEAFALICRTGLPAHRQVHLVQTLASASGRLGMVGGQMIDLASVNTAVDLNHLQAMHALKTGALIRAAVALGAIAAGASPEQLAALDEYANKLGLAFQVQDDILDIESDTETLGKQQGADQHLNKPTYPALLGMEGAKASALRLHAEARAALTGFGEHARYLHELADYVIQRRY